MICIGAICHLVKPIRVTGIIGICQRIDLYVAVCSLCRGVPAQGGDIPANIIVERFIKTAYIIIEQSGACCGTLCVSCGRIPVKRIVSVFIAAFIAAVTTRVFAHPFHC